MRKAMADAEVGDAVFGDDPLVNRLQAVAAERFGFDGALFVPSGTMSNQIALGTMGAPGDAVLVPEFAHVARWEGGGAAASFGVHLVLVRDVGGDAGLPTFQSFEQHLYYPHPKAPRVIGMALENTHNWAGGRVFDRAALEARTAPARARGLHVHLDGARLFNAAVALGVDAATLAAPFDSVSICLSKGLGAPVGSLLLGSKAFLARADRIRQRLGGGWRQAGMLAAAGLHALDHHVARLADDHARARVLAEALVAHGIGRPLHAIDSNIIQFEVDARFDGAAGLAARCEERAIRFFPTGVSTARLVTHLDVGDEDVENVVNVWKSL
jgi:threonine aldolase